MKKTIKLTKDELKRKLFHKGQRIAFWGKSHRIGRIVKMYSNVAAVRNNQEIWLVPYTCCKPT